MTNRHQDQQWKDPTLKPPRRRFLMAGRGRSPSARQLTAALDLNRLMAEVAAGALDERALMDGALSVLTRLAGALGCSYVPVDEWQQSLPSFTYGQIPAPVLAAWSAKLTSGLLRDRCGVCNLHHSKAGECPLHPAEVGDAIGVYCLPVSVEGEIVDRPVRDRRTGRALGVLNLYLPQGKRLHHSTRVFIDRVLPDISLAYEAARLRSQEAATLRQLNLHNDPESDLLFTLKGLLEGLRKALDADYALIRVRPSGAERVAGLNLRVGAVENSALPFDEHGLENLVEGALDAVLRDGQAASPSASLPAWIALPLSQPFTAAEFNDDHAVQSSRHNGRPAPVSPEIGPNPASYPGRIQGMVMVISSHPRRFHPRQQAILQTVTSQAALLVEFERKFRSLEYSVVIQERARLAREIHDGLAQTLAFLKLQAAQMQAQLAQGDLDRLAQVLNDSYHVLGEAYLDTRQAIDNLRMTPQDGLEQWIARIIREFERKTGLKVEQAVQPLTRPLPPEVQAQLIRIVQEALSNVRKHARAQRVRVCLCEQHGLLALEVIDDGQGFDVADLPDVSRHGLRGMRERAEMIGADFQIITQPHQGTTMRLAIPVWDNEEHSA